MKRRTKRIKIWLFLLLLLAAVVGYFYYNRQSAVAPSSENATPAPNNLIYLSTLNGADAIKNYDLKSSKTTTLAKSGSVGEVVSLIDNPDSKDGLLLRIIDKKYMLSVFDYISGKISDLSDLTAYNPIKAYHLSDDSFAIIGGEKKSTLTILDSKYLKLSSFESNNEITAVGKGSNRYYLTFANFDGSGAKLFSFSTEDNKSEDFLSLDGKVSQFNEQSVLYAKRINIKSDDPANPAGQTYWKITVYSEKDKTENIISEGNFDQNGICDQYYKYFAYQKKLDTSDQADGRVFIINAENDTDRIETGRPLTIF